MSSFAKETGIKTCHPLPPTQAPRSLIYDLQTTCSAEDVQGFEEAFNLWRSLSGNIIELDPVMMTAIQYNLTDVVAKFLSAGLPHHVDYALQAVKYNALNALDTLVSCGLDINEPLGSLKPPVLGYATDEVVATWLIDHGADPNQQCSIDLTPLSLVVETAPLNVVKLLLQYVDIQKGQLLHHAIKREADIIPTLRILFTKGALSNLNLTWYKHHFNSWRLFYFMGLGTPLHNAAERGNVEVVRFLLSHGADTTIRDANERTAYDCAIIAGFNDVAEVLRRS